MMKLAEIQAACGVLCVDLAAVVDNYQTLARHVAPAQCGAVLKANGYGLGEEAIAPALYAANCRVFFVAQLSEGVALRKILSADAWWCCLMASCRRRCRFVARNRSRRC